MKQFFSRVLVVVLLGCVCAGPASAADAPKQEIVFADVGWDSVQLNNAIAGLIAEEVFGYTWSEVPASTAISHEALIQGDVDVVMEEWTDNIASYPQDLQNGRFVELGINFNDNYQGFYIPRYVADANPGLKKCPGSEGLRRALPRSQRPLQGLYLWRHSGLERHGDHAEKGRRVWSF